LTFGRGSIDAPYLIKPLRGFDGRFQSLQGCQVGNRLDLGDYGLCCLAEFEIEHASNAFAQTFGVPLLDTDFFDAGNIGHLAFLLKRAQLLCELCSQFIRQAQQPIHEAEGQMQLLGSIAEAIQLLRNCQLSLKTTGQISAGASGMYCSPPTI